MSRPLVCTGIFASATFCVVAGFGSSIARADEIANFNFDSTNPAATSPQTSSVAPADGATVSTLAIAPNYTRGGYDNNGGTSKSALAYYDNADMTTLSNAEAANDALQITITPGSTPLTITSVELDSYDYADQGMGYLVDSVNGPNSPDGSAINGANPAPPTTISFTDLTDLTSPITFDVYSVGVGGYVDKGVHSLEIDGVAAVPEPASIGLLAVTSLGALTRRRSRSGRSA